MFEYVTQHLGVPDEHVILHGRSIGGGVSLAVAGNHPTCCVCNERSFASLYVVIVVLFRAISGVDAHKPAATDPFKVKAKHMLKVCAVYTVAGLARCIGWDYPCTQNWNKVSGYKWAFYHPQDTVIPLEASLYNGVQHTTDPFYRFRMGGDAPEAHNRALTDEEEAWNQNMMVSAIPAIDRRGGGSESREVDV